MYEIISANKLISSRFNFENNISIAIHENSVLFYVTFFVRLFPSRNAFRERREAIVSRLRSKPIQYRIETGRKERNFWSWSPLTPRHIFHLTTAAAAAAASPPRSWLALIVMLFGPYAITR